MNDDREGTTDTAKVRVRRAPKIPVFLIAGGGLGAVVTFIVTALYPTDPNIGFGTLFGYFLIFGIPAGVVVGAVVALLLDRRASKHAQAVDAERIHVDAVPEEVEGEIEQ
ncbi:hypothetical protein [Salinibacterium sp. ZJ450]|uniref:hypothetical protein n=1 Tax=Salinibacterium sp. ZJ450 TaxID=2708338 RepID=UPI001421242B|nr:hypothetical protein [Salinibacterium sp. ZJ450]